MKVVVTSKGRKRKLLVSNQMSQLMALYKVFFLEHAGELRIFELRRREGPITVKPYHTLDQSEGGVEKTLKGLLHIKTDT